MALGDNNSLQCRGTGGDPPELTSGVEFELGTIATYSAVGSSIDTITLNSHKQPGPRCLDELETFTSGPPGSHRQLGDVLLEKKS
jgi:hypothetical protein